MKKCENCSKEHDQSYASGRFCSSKCAREFSTKAKRKEINEKVSNTLKKYYDKNGRKIYEFYCKQCNKKIDKNLYCFNCNSWRKYKLLFQKVGTYKKNISYEIINKKTIKILYDLYFNKGYSKVYFKENFNLRENTVYNYFKKNNINLRTLSEANKNALFYKRSVPQSNKQYKHGWHESWNGNMIYYRSSYELKYAKYLDKNKIPYEVESKSLLYFDTQKNDYRIAIPDFYLPLENKIIEIKSEYTYDEQNMIDRVKVFKEYGYNFELVMEDKLNKL